MKRYLTLPKRKQKEPVDDAPTSRLQCSRCKTIFANYHTVCPECGSEDWISYTELNPYSRMPLESVLQICGHLFWIAGTVLFLTILWQTDSTEPEANKWTIYMGFLCLALGVLFSALYFGLSEIIMRILRLQRRLKAFHDNYRDTGQSMPVLSRRNKTRTLIQYGTIRRSVKNKSKKKVKK